MFEAVCEALNGGAAPSSRAEMTHQDGAFWCRAAENKVETLNSAHFGTFSRESLAGSKNCA
ncbi:MAG TPA: hypothetical protein PK072_13645, partial [Quisquiliibacterium sp.]|nr:hypothetical protein [Quisquiliibacterium sp.]